LKQTKETQESMGEKDGARDVLWQKLSHISGFSEGLMHARKDTVQNKPE
jgi:hypothetical protein